MTKKSTATALILMLLSASSLFAQLPGDSTLNNLDARISKTEKDLSFWQKLKVNGWIQAQYQQTDTVGAASVAGGNFSPYSDNRFILRRGRIKFTYENGSAQYVLQMDVIDPTLTAPLNSTTTATNTIPFAVNVRDFYVKLFVPKMPVSLTVGMQNRPFGFEVAQSSQFRETPERSRFTQTLFTNERDLGAMVTIQGPKGSKWNMLKTNLGLFNGTGIAREFDAKKDFIGQVMLNNASSDKKWEYGIGASYYYGKVLQTDSTVYSGFSGSNGSTVYNNSKQVSNIGAYANRIYSGIDAQISYTHVAGTTTLRGEYVTGTQPGVSSSSRSPEIIPTGATYVRPFEAGYFYFVHQIKKVQFVFKYDFYDPNSKVAGKEVNSAGKFGSGDIRYDTYGYGINYLVNSNVKFMFYYDVVKNEIANIAGFGYDRKDNIFTARVQYRF